MSLCKRKINMEQRKLNPVGVARSLIADLNNVQPLSKRELERVVFVLKFIEKDIPNCLSRLDADSKRAILRELTDRI